MAGALAIQSCLPGMGADHGIPVPIRVMTGEDKACRGGWAATGVRHKERGDRI